MANEGRPLPGAVITVTMGSSSARQQGKQHVDHALKKPTLDAAAGRSVGAGVIYVIAFITGGIVMSFEMLGSRYLNPYFGSGIYTWAALISTVLAALTLGYFLGGWLADRTASAAGVGPVVLGASPFFFPPPPPSPGLLGL